MSDGAVTRAARASRLPVLLAIVVVVALEVGVVEPDAAVEIVLLVTVLVFALGLLLRLWARVEPEPTLPGHGIGGTELLREVGRLRLAIEDGARDRAGLVYTLGRHVRPLAEARLARAGVDGDVLAARLDDPRAREVLGPTVHELLSLPRPRGGDRRAPGWDHDRLELLLDELEAEAVQAGASAGPDETTTGGGRP